MSPCGRTNEQTSEYRATQSMDSVRLSFAIYKFIIKRAKEGTIQLGIHYTELANRRNLRYCYFIIIIVVVVVVKM